MLLGRLRTWWAHAAFAGEAERGLGRWPARWWVFMLLAGVAGVLFYSRLGCALLEPEEARYAEIPRQMLAEGRFITPVLHGQDYYQKPPLLYWLVMLCYQSFGVHDWAARLVPATAGVLTVLSTYAWAYRTLGPRAAFVSGIILTLSARFLYLGGMLGMDSLLCLWVIAGLATGHIAVGFVGQVSNLPAERWQVGNLPHGWWWIASAGCCGLGVLTKGPVAAALIVVPLFVYIQLDRRTARIGWSGWALYGAIAFAIAGPWFIAVALTDPEAAASFFWLHNVVRYIAAFDHEEPAWFYLPGLVLGTLPWSILLIPCGVYLMKTSPRWARRRPAALGLFFVAFAWIIGFFSLSGCKRAGYILPAFPLLAVVLGTFLTRVYPSLFRLATQQSWRWQARGRGLGVGVCCLALQMGLVGAWLAVVGGIWTWPAVLAATLLLDAPCVVMWLARSRVQAPQAWAAATAITFGLLLCAGTQLLPHYHRQFSLRGQVRRHLELAQDGAVICYPKRWDSVSFYLRRPVLMFDGDDGDKLAAYCQQQPQALAFVKNGRYLAEFLQHLPEGWSFEKCGRPGNRLTAGYVRRRLDIPVRTLSGASCAGRTDKNVHPTFSLQAGP